MNNLVLLDDQEQRIITKTLMQVGINPHQHGLISPVEHRSLGLVSQAMEGRQAAYHLEVSGPSGGEVELVEAGASSLSQEVLLRGCVILLVQFAEVLPWAECSVPEGELVRQPVEEWQHRGMAVVIPEPVGSLHNHEHAADREHLPGVSQRCQPLRYGHVLQGGEKDDEVETRLLERLRHPV